MAALDDGVITPDEIYNDDGVFKIDILKLQQRGRRRLRARST